jgi:Family of unknown function (DUF5999)
MCKHQPACPDAQASDRMAARVTTTHPEQGWSLLCNGVVLFDDAGALLPGGQGVEPQPVVSAFCPAQAASAVRALAAAA